MRTQFFLKKSKTRFRTADRKEKRGWEYLVGAHCRRRGRSERGADGGACAGAGSGGRAAAAREGKREEKKSQWAALGGLLLHIVTGQWAAPGGLFSLDGLHFGSPTGTREEELKPASTSPRFGYPNP